MKRLVYHKYRFNVIRVNVSKFNNEYYINSQPKKSVYFDINGNVVKQENLETENSEIYNEVKSYYSKFFE